MVALFEMKNVRFPQQSCEPEKPISWFIIVKVIVANNINGKKTVTRANSNETPGWAGGKGKASLQTNAEAPEQA